MDKRCCIACEHELTLFGSRQGYSYYRCARCRTLQLHPLPTPEQLAEAYRAEYASAEHISSNPDACIRLSQPYYRALVRTLQRFAPDAAVAEIGAGWGGLADLLRKEGFAYGGVEPSEEMSAYCQAKGLPIVHGTIENLPAGPWDALVLCSVFEHLVNHADWLARAKMLLKPGGLLVTSQPTAAFAATLARIVRLGDTRKPLPQLHQIFCPPWHTVLFSVEGMCQLLDRNGFDVVEVAPAPQGREPGLNGLLQRTLETVNRVGWSVSGIHWPLMLSHVFVFRVRP